MVQTGLYRPSWSSLFVWYRRQMDSRLAKDEVCGHNVVDISHSGMTAADISGVVHRSRDLISLLLLV